MLLLEDIIVNEDEHIKTTDQFNFFYWKFMYQYHWKPTFVNIIDIYGFNVRVTNITEINVADLIGIYKVLNNLTNRIVYEDDAGQQSMFLLRDLVNKNNSDIPFTQNMHRALCQSLTEVLMTHTEDFKSFYEYLFDVLTQYKKVPSQDLENIYDPLSAPENDGITVERYIDGYLTNLGTKGECWDGAYKFFFEKVYPEERLSEKTQEREPLALQSQLPRLPKLVRATSLPPNKEKVLMNSILKGESQPPRELRRAASNLGSYSRTSGAQSRTSGAQSRTSGARKTFPQIGGKLTKLDHYHNKYYPTYSKLYYE
jgi:hypothetical protein